MKLWGPYAIIRYMMLLLRRHIMCLASQWSEVTEERCDMDRSRHSILKRQVGERVVWGWVIPPTDRDGAGKSFFKHLTGAECGLPCLRVIATRPLLCTGVITLHFTSPVILACCDSVFEQHGGSWSDWLNMMFFCMTECTESQRASCLSNVHMHLHLFVYSGLCIIESVDSFSMLTCGRQIPASRVKNKAFILLASTFG